MSFVFISHASEDKPRIRPIVDALRAAGLRVFLDNPDRADYSEKDIATGDFVRLHYDRSWDQQLREAMRASHAMLVCWSKAARKESLAADRDTWRGEIDYALISGKALNVVVDEVRPKDLYKGGGEHQCLADTDKIDDGWHAAIAQLIQDIKRVMERVAYGDARTAKARRGDLALPIYANRHPQENAFNAALRAVEDQGGAHPIILHGPENELPEDLVKRMSELSGELAAQGARWHEVRSPYWPQEARTPRAFQDAYRLELTSRLKCRGGDQDHRIAERLAGEEVTAIIHRLKAKDWRRDEGVRVQAWIDYWNDLGRAHVKVRVLPVLVAPLRKAKPGWHKEDGKRYHPPGASGGPIDNARLSRILGEAAKRASETNTTLSDLPILGPIRRRDAEEWLEDWKDRLPADSVTGARQLVDAMFGKRRFLGPNPERQGVTHGDFLDRLKDICAGAAQAPT